MSRVEIMGSLMTADTPLERAYLCIGWLCNARGVFIRPRTVRGVGCGRKTWRKKPRGPWRSTLGSSEDVGTKTAGRWQAFECALKWNSSWSQSTYIYRVQSSVWRLLNYWPPPPLHPHCKKSWRSSSTPASGDAGPIHTGVEQSFRHPWIKFYYKYRTFPTIFTSVELVRQSWKVSKAALAAHKPTPYRVTICHSTTAPHSLPNISIH